MIKRRKIKNKKFEREKSYLEVFRNVNPLFSEKRPLKAKRQEIRI